VGERIVAIFEAAKGVIVLLAGFGLLTLVHKNVQMVAEEIIMQLHLNPAKHYPGIFVDLASHIGDTQLWMLALLAIIYASLRLLEAYGLWLGTRWAQWLAVITGGIYVSLEIYEILSKYSWIKLLTLIVNVGIVLYMSYRIRTELGIKKIDI
jgi:uncharacterized membrane protein (DUF2068 family)